MELSDYIHETVFEEKEQHKYLYELLWANLEEDGYVITDEPGNEIDAVFKSAEALWANSFTDSMTRLTKPTLRTL